MDKRTELFFDLMKYLKNVSVDGIIDEDSLNQENIAIDDRLTQIAISEKINTNDFFRNIIDQPPYMSNDYKMLRKLLMDWYSSHRSLITISKKAPEIYNLSDIELDEIIRSFGFPFPHFVTEKENFIFDLVNLYQKKGTPKVLVTALQTYFGLENVILSEWWLDIDNQGNIYARPIPIYPKGAITTNKNIPFNAFIFSNPSWRISRQRLLDLYNNKKISFPIITSNISLQTNAEFETFNRTICVLARIIEEQYQYWITNTEISINMKSIYLTELFDYYSIIECFIIFSYIYDNGATTTDKRALMYNGEYLPIDDNNDGIPDIEEFDMIIEEYNNINNTRPTSRAEKYQLLELKKQKFTVEINSDILGIVKILENPEYYLNLLNPNLKNTIDNLITNKGKEDVGKNIIRDFGFYLQETLNLFDFSFVHLLYGSSSITDIYDVINFFKPYHTILRDFQTSFTINNPLDDCMIIDDRFVTKFFINQFSINTIGLDYGNASDKYKLFITSTIGNDSLYSNDLLNLVIRLMHNDNISVIDIFTPKYKINEYSFGTHGLDYGAVIDKTINKTIQISKDYLSDTLDKFLSDGIYINITELSSIIQINETSCCNDNSTEIIIDVSACQICSQ